jgi:prevent-host-death family protein
MQLVGIRDLKNKLAHYLEIAKKGDAIIITDRGGLWQSCITSTT